MLAAQLPRPGFTTPEPNKSHTGYSLSRVDVAGSGDGTLTLSAVVRCEMDRCVGAAARLLGGDRKDLAVQALARSETVSDLVARHGVSRKFVYQQTHKARAVLDDAFSPAVPDSEVLFELTVTKAWLRQVIVGLTLICRSSSWMSCRSFMNRASRSMRVTTKVLPGCTKSSSTCSSVRPSRRDPLAFSARTTPS